MKEKPNEYRINVTDCDGRPKDSYLVHGESLYSAYHDFMVEKGYIKESDQKTKTKKYNGSNHAFIFFIIEA